MYDNPNKLPTTLILTNEQVAEIIAKNAPPVAVAPPSEARSQVVRDIVNFIRSSGTKSDVICGAEYFTIVPMPNGAAVSERNKAWMAAIEEKFLK